VNDLSRRSFLAWLAAGGVAACTGPLSPSSIPGPPFALGVASGDPLAHRVMLWTRLAPVPLAGGGMPDRDVEVLWEVARDRHFSDVVRDGVSVAEPRHAHSVHVDVKRLEPDTWYWYRFRVGRWVSPVGRTRTAPAPGASPRGNRVRFGFASCQDFGAGYYGAYDHLVADRLDLLVWLGDYIYESGSGGDLRSQPGGEARTLADYRNRYALYNGDASLQAARAAQPWLVLWDDHEVVDNYQGLEERPGTSEAEFEARRAAAYQAWWEHQPVRVPAPDSSGIEIHKAVEWGNLVSFFVLDERQYRDPRVCPSIDDIGSCPAADAPHRTMLGAAQRQWLFDELDHSHARWNVLANEVVMTRMSVLGLLNLDQWDGFSAERDALMAKLGARPDLNPLVITGDIHAFGMADLKDGWEPDAPIVGTELIGGSISSSGLSLFDVLPAVVPHLHFANGSVRGYGVVDLTPATARCRFRAVESVAQRTSPVSTIAEFEVTAGRPGARRLR
jgi:alkaline phosphatase D